MSSTDLSLTHNLTGLQGKIVRIDEERAVAWVDFEDGFSSEVLLPEIPSLLQPPGTEMPDKVDDEGGIALQ
jgi:hypothetical protein